MAGKARLTGKNNTDALKLLKDVTTILERYNIWYCLDGGTLLGIMRENRLLPWDNDLDIFVHQEECRKVVSLRWKFRSRGYWVRISRLQRNISPMKKGDVRVVKIRNRRFIFFAGPAKLDVFIKHRQGNRLYWVEGPKNRYVQKSSPTKLFRRTILKEFTGKQYWIPEAYDEYLTHRYGDWLTPVEAWNHLTDDRAIIKR